MNDGREFATRQSIHGHLSFLPRFNFGLEALSQSKIKQDRFDVLDVDHVGTIFQIVTHVDLTQACSGIKWRKHFQALKRGLGQRQFGKGHLKRCVRFIQGALADEVLRNKFLVPSVVGLCNGQLGFGLCQLCSRQLIVKLYQELSLFNFLPVFKKNLADTATHLGAQHHTLKRTQATDRLGLVHQHGFFNLGNFYSRRFLRSTRTRRTTGSSTCCATRRGSRLSRNSWGARG